MASINDDEVPIALRKGKRRSDVLSSPVKARAASTSTAMKTPSTRRTKRVRFSDPGLFSPSTSLTPAFRRSSLATPKQRRPGTPGRQAIEGTIQFTPFTQTLDERCQRRIRRNGLSEELNAYESEKKSSTVLQKELDEKEAELQRLRKEIEEARNAQSGLIESQPPPPSSQARADEIEAELEILQKSFSSSQGGASVVPPIEWNNVPHLPGPDSDSGDTIPIFEDDDVDSFHSSHRQPSQEIQTEVSAMSIELEAAKEAKSSFLESFRDQGVNTSFDFDFADSPARSQQASQTTDRIPETQLSFVDVKKQLNEATSRAEEAEVALTALDIEISELGFGNVTDDTLTMVAAISSHFRTARLELERLLPGEISSGFVPPRILPEILLKTKTLSDRLKIRENDLKAAKDQHRNLKNNFEKAIVAAEKANERIKKLEGTIDTSSEDTLHIRMYNQELERDITEKEKDITSLSNALNKYRNDITRLENLINTLQSEYELKTQTNEELEARVASETTGRRAAEVSAVQRLARINELENNLANTRRQVADLEARLSASSVSPNEEITFLNGRISNLATSLATANAEVDRLRTTKARLEERVRAEAEQGAHAVETLQEQLIRTVMRGNEAKKKYVNGSKIRIANWELSEDISSDGATYVEQSSPSSRRSSVKFAEYAEVEVFERDSPHNSQEVEADADESGSESVPGSVEVYRGRGKYRKTPKLVTYDQAKRGHAKKRKYDSGIGMDSDFEIYDESVDKGLMTPELSSDGGESLEGDREMEMVM